MYINQSLKTYLDDLAAKKPAPGGGSAAALTSALAAALVSMVCNFTIGRDKYKEHEEKVKAILQKSESLRSELEKLLDLDVETYNKVAAARKAQNLNDTLLKQAESVPEQVCKYCYEGINLCAELVDIGNPNLISDVGAASLFFLSGFEAAQLNVEINLKFIKDKEFSAIIKSSLTKAHRELVALNQRIGVKVGKAITNVP